MFRCMIIIPKNTLFDAHAGAAWSCPVVKNEDVGAALVAAVADAGACGCPLRKVIFWVEYIRF